MKKNVVYLFLIPLLSGSFYSSFCYAANWENSVGNKSPEMRRTRLMNVVENRRSSRGWKVQAKEKTKVYSRATGLKGDLLQGISDYRSIREEKSEIVKETPRLSGNMRSISAPKRSGKGFMADTRQGASSKEQRVRSKEQGARGKGQVVRSKGQGMREGFQFIVNEAPLYSGQTRLSSWNRIGDDIVSYKQYVFWKNVMGGVWNAMKMIVLLGVVLLGFPIIERKLPTVSCILIFYRW